jgi:hypothetical protein
MLSPVDPLTALPARFAAGTTVKYRRSYSDFRAGAGWTLKLHLAGPSVKQWSAAPDGDVFAFTLPASETAALTPGSYRWIERASKAGEEYDAAAGMLTVTVDVAKAGVGELQSWAEKALAEARDALSALINGRVQGFQIGSRVFTKLDLPELRKLVVELESRVAREQGSGSIGRIHQFRFTRPS